MNSNSLKILLIEDSPDDAEIILYELVRAAFSVEYRRVETAHEMHSALTDQTWDLVLSDYAMPHFSGAAALGVLQAMGADIPFIIVSGAIGEERAVEIMRAGAHDYVMKGNLKRLVPAIQRELREAQSRRARRTAEEQVTKLSRALEQSANLVMITSIHGVIEYINPAFTQITGYTPGEVVGVHSRILHSDTTPHETYQQLWNTVKSGETWRGELQNKKKNGELYWVEAVISAVKNSAGDIIEIVAVQEDISERKHLEAEIQRYTTQLEKMVEERTSQLRQTKEQIEIILNNSTDGIALIQMNGDIQKRNPAFDAMFGSRVSKCVEYILWTVANEQQSAQVGHALLKTIYDRESQRIEARIVMDDGQDKDVDLGFIPVQFADMDNNDGFLINAHDITYLKEIERFKARFVADAVHDLATPISGLSTRLYMLRQTPEKLDLHVRALENQVTHLRNLLSDLRTLSQLDRGQLALTREVSDFNKIVMRVFDTYEPVAISRQQTLTQQLDTGLPEIPLDCRQIERVIVNLVSNAVNYTPNGRAIHVQTMLESDYLLFRIADEGIGIDTQDLPHIFDRFFRSEQARQTQASGTGLGLAIVREIVELHGGTISVSSEPGKGSVFSLQLPCQTASV